MTGFHSTTRRIDWFRFRLAAALLAGVGLVCACSTAARAGPVRDRLAGPRATAVHQLRLIYEKAIKSTIVAKEQRPEHRVPYAVMGLRLPVPSINFLAGTIKQVCRTAPISPWRWS